MTLVLPMNTCTDPKLQYSEISGLEAPIPSHTLIKKKKKTLMTPEQCTWPRTKQSKGISKEMESHQVESLIKSSRTWEQEGGQHTAQQ